MRVAAVVGCAAGAVCSSGMAAGGQVPLWLRLRMHIVWVHNHGCGRCRQWAIMRVRAVAVHVREARAACAVRVEATPKVLFVSEFRIIFTYRKGGRENTMGREHLLCNVYFSTMRAATDKRSSSVERFAQVG